jgi:glutaminase
MTLSTGVDALGSRILRVLIRQCWESGHVSTMHDTGEALEELAAEMLARQDKGVVADYIPELAHIDPNRFGVAIAYPDGSVSVGGDADEPFSIQSISKVFTLTLALGTVGDDLWRRVRREPSGNPFNSIIQLETEGGIPRNPFLNSGSLVVADILLGTHEPREAIGEILRFVRFIADDDTVAIEERAAHSERKIDFRNVALANYLAAFGNLRNTPSRVLGVYVHHCAISMSCRQLALAGLFLATGGHNPRSGTRLISAERARRVNALMLTCGQYQGSGDFAFQVGLPAKSGVGGGIFATVPGRASIAVWSPGLNGNGSSHLGCVALERLVTARGWSVFGA